jgi:peroxiredoxin
MSGPKVNSTPLEYGALAPEFALESTTGETIRRGQFRNKQALVLVFFLPTPEAESYLQALARDAAEYKELNARIIGLGRAARKELEPLAARLPFILLADANGVAWKAYSGSDQPGYGVFVLDMYGGVDSQQMADSVAGLPDAKTVLEWTRAAQYRCNI